MKPYRIQALIAAVLISIGFAPSLAYAAPSESGFDDVESAAESIAQQFVDSIQANENIVARSPSLFCNSEGAPEGYIVSFFDSDENPCGYVILDSTYPNLISEYVLQTGVLNPFVDYSNLMSSNPAYFQNGNTNTIQKIDPFTYALVDDSSETAKTNYGDAVQIEETISAQSAKPSNWRDIFLQYTNSSFKITDSQWVTPFIGRTQSDIQNATGGVYACAVVALIDCAEYYDPAFYSDSLTTTFWRIWNATDSYYDSNNAYQGYTLNSNLCSGFKQYMATRGVTIQTYGNSNPSWMQYKVNADEWNMSLFCAGINSAINGTREGHAMSVQGYAILEPLGVLNESIRVLGVHDGWNNYARYVNYDFPNYTDTYGAFFG